MNVEPAVGRAASDACLIEALKGRSVDALAEVYRRHGDAVVGFARSRSGDPSGAEDVAQEVFLALWLHPTRFDPSRGSLRTYLLTLTHHRTIDVFRSEQSRRRRQAEFSPVTGPQPDVEDSVVTAEDAVRLRRTLDNLPSEERRAIDLAYFGHRTYREVALLLGKPEGTIKSRIRTGLRRLGSSPELATATAEYTSAG